MDALQEHERSVVQAVAVTEAEDMPWVIASAVAPGVELATGIGNAEFPRLGLLAGRGAAIVRDVWLTLDAGEVLEPTVSHRVVPRGSIHDTCWSNPHVPPRTDAGEIHGRLTILYRHANWSLWKTESDVRVRDRVMVVDAYARTAAVAKEIRPATSR
jgi:hypothetical protein